MANLFEPGTFEGGTETWVAVSATTVTAPAESPHGGTHSLKTVCPGAAGTEGCAKEVAATGGTKYKFTAWFKGISGKKYRMRFEDNKVLAEDQPFTGTGAYQEISGEFTIGATATALTVQVRVAELVAGNFFLDDVVVEPVVAASTAKPGALVAG